MATKWHCPEDWSEWVEWLAAGLHGRCRWRLPLLVSGMLFAKGRRTVTTWLRAAGLHADFADYYYFLAAVGQSTWPVAILLLGLLLRRLPDTRVLLALDDSPTQRYGLKVQGAGIHRHHAQGPMSQQFVYGHVWVTLSGVVRHSLWGTIGLPLLALLYVRAQDIGKIPPRYGGEFQTKLKLAERLVTWAAALLRQAGRELWVVVDGFYAKRPFVKSTVASGAVLVGRLPKNARLTDVPPRRRRGQQRGCGRPRIYGRHRLHLAKRAGQKRGWETVEGTGYGRTVPKTIKTFLATSRLRRGVIRVVIVKEKSRVGVRSSAPTRTPACERFWKPTPTGRPSSKTSTT